MLLICYFVSACAIVAMVSGEHWEMSVIKASEAVTATLNLDSTMSTQYAKNVTALQKEATDFFLPRNLVFDKVSVYVKEDVAKLIKGIQRVRTKVQVVAAFVQGCPITSNRDSCDVGNSSVAHRRDFVCALL